MLNQLTGLRALLALWVVCLHFLCNESAAQYFWFAPVFSHGNLAVHGFFVLSGFILCKVYPGLVTPFSFKTYRSFLVARIARIYPLHVVMLAALVPAVVLNRWLHLPNTVTGFSTKDLGLSLLLVQAWGIVLHPVWNGVAWSISAEWFAYLLFPVFLFLVGRRFLAVAPIVVLLSMVALHWVKVTQATLHGPPGLYRTALVMVCGNFALGCLAHKTTILLRTRFVWLGSAAGLLALTFATFRLNELFSLSFAILLVGLSNSRDWLSRPLSLRPVVYLGETSFALYMVHTFVLSSVLAIAGRLLGFRLESAPYLLTFGAFAFAILASVALYHLVEVPARAYIRGLGTNGRPTAIAASSARAGAALPDADPA